MSKNNYGLTALIGGILQVILGFAVSFLNLAIFIITIIAGIYSFKKENDNLTRRKMAIIGIGLALLMVVVHFIFGWPGILGFLFADRLLVE